MNWPGAAQVCRLERTTTRNGKQTTEIAYAITSAPRERADAKRVLAWWRGHWGIENRLHYVRDTAFDEDRCRVRTRGSPQVLAAFRNTAISLLRQNGETKIASTLRRLAAQPMKILAMLGIVKN